MSEPVKTRCKFQVAKVADLQWEAYRDKEATGQKCQEITLHAVCGDKDPENASFASSTPTGVIVFTVTNPDVIGTFKPNTYYYVDLIPV